MADTYVTITLPSGHTIRVLDNHVLPPNIAITPNNKTLYVTNWVDAPATVAGGSSGPS